MELGYTVTGVNAMATVTKGIDWETFSELRGSEKKEYFTRDGNIFHVIMSQQFDRQFLDEICELTTKIRGIAKGNKGIAFLQSLLQGNIRGERAGRNRDRHAVERDRRGIVIHRAGDRHGSRGGKQIILRCGNRYYRRGRVQREGPARRYGESRN